MPTVRNSGEYDLDLVLEDGSTVTVQKGHHSPEMSAAYRDQLVEQGPWTEVKPPKTDTTKAAAEKSDTEKEG